MTIRAGEPWGEPIVIAGVVRPIASDRALAELVGELGGDRCGDGRPLIRPTGGDLARTVGLAAAPLPEQGSTAMSCPIDVGWATADSGTRCFVAHCVVRRSWWWGDVTLAMNAQYHGRWDVAPRSHPNDGRLDVVTVSSAMTVGQRWQASRRAERGDHLPHPAMKVTKAAERTLTFVRPQTVWLDGVRWCRTRNLTLRVESDAMRIIV